MRRFWQYEAVLLLLPGILDLVLGLSTSTRRKISFPSKTRIPLKATTKNVVYDGPEWISIQDCLDTVKKGSADAYGKMTVVVGTPQDDDGDKIVGVVASEDVIAKTVTLKENNNLQVYQDSVAKVPKSVKDEDALNTMIAALTAVQCTLPKVEGVGGADTTEENSMVSGKVVILGGSDYACFAAEGLAALGSRVSLISTNKVKVQNKNVEVLPPAVGEDEIGFASFVGEFDALLDTADDERPSKRFFADADDSDDDEEEAEDMMAMGTTIRLLKQRHKCERYVSSMTKAQSIVNREGVFFGPGKVKNHVKEIQQQLEAKPSTFQTIVPPPSFGRTVETLLEKGILYKNNKDFLGNNNNVLRGWSLKDFMETSTWPTDSSAGGTRTVRFGLPVLEEQEEWAINGEEEDGGEFTLISAPPETADMEIIERDAWDKEVAAEEKARQDKDMNNPFVKKIVGEQGLYDTIVKEKRDCVLFMSAPFCRTCKTLNPRFTTLARQTMEEFVAYGDEEGILFAKADAMGDVGKDLSRSLKVNAVPAFLLFRNGRRFGPALSISRIPSKKLSAAIELLDSGLDWDSNVIKSAEDKRR